jgi:hypothetical protein
MYAAGATALAVQFGQAGAAAEQASHVPQLLQAGA